MISKFKRETESGLILVNIEIDNKFELRMILDTGATNTTIDSNALYLLGHDLKDSVGTVEYHFSLLPLRSLPVHQYGKKKHKKPEHSTK
jgi:hypothetical protein